MTAPDAAGLAVTTELARGAGVSSRVGERPWLALIARAGRRAALYAAPLVVFLQLTVALSRHSSFDAQAYWSANLDHLYASSKIGTFGAYLYSPAFAQAIQPLTWLPFEAFYIGWLVMLALVLLWLGGPVLFLPLILLTPVSWELTSGNIHLLLAAVIVLGFRHPWLWAFVLLTKVTPGLGLLWFAARREWRNLAIALGATLAVVIVSALLAPGLWIEWFQTLATNASYNGPASFPAYPLVVRLPIAALLTIWAARRDMKWVLPIACTIALPAIYLTSLPMLVASWYLWRTTSGRAAVRGTQDRPRPLSTSPSA